MAAENQVVVQFLGKAEDLFSVTKNIKRELNELGQQFRNFGQRVTFPSGFAAPIQSASAEFRALTDSIGRHVRESQQQTLRTTRQGITAIVVAEKQKAAEVVAIERQTVENARQQARLRIEVNRRRIAQELADERAREREGRRQISNQISTASRGIGSDVGSGVAGGLGIPIGVVGTVAAVTAAAVVGGKAVLEYSSRLEQARIGLETMSGSAETATRHLQELQQFARTTPFQFPELVDASQKLQGVGISADRVIPILTDVGNALAAAGRIGDLPFAVKALGDIQAKGKLAGQEIIQLANAGIPIRDVLAKSLGVTQAEVISLGEKGQITSEQVFAAIHQLSETRFGDAMAKQSKTFSGAMSNITDSLNIAASRAFAPFYEKVSSLAVEASEAIEKQGEDLTAVGTTIADYIAKGLGVGLEQAIRGLPGAIGQLIKYNATGGVLRSFSEGAAESTLSNFYSPEQIAQARKQRERGVFDVLFNGSNQFSDQTVDGNTVKFLDTASFTIKEINLAANETPSVAEKLEAPKAAADLSKLAVAARDFQQKRIEWELDLVKAQEDGNKNGLESIRRVAAAEEIAIRQRILAERDLYNLQMNALSISDREGSPGSTLRTSLLQKETQAEYDLERVRIEARKREQADIDEAKKKVGELKDKYMSVYDDIIRQSNDDNPFVSLFSSAEKAIKKVREETKGLTEDLRQQFQAMQVTTNRYELFKERLNSVFEAFDLREFAANFRNPEDPEKQKTQMAQWRRSFLTENPNYLFLKQQEFDARQRDSSDPISLGLKTFEQFINDDLKLRSSALFPNSAQAKLDRALDLVRQQRPSNDREAAVLDQRIVSLGRSQNPLELTPGQRDEIASAAERQATRVELREQNALTLYKAQLKVQEGILESNIGLLKIAGSEGTKGLEKLLIKVKKDTADIGVQIEEPTQEDTRNNYDYLNFRGILPG